VHRGSCFFRFLFILLLIGGVAMAVNTAYRNGFALGYMTAEANDGGQPAAAAQAPVAPVAPGILSPWGPRQPGGISPFAILFFGFAVFFILSRMGRHRYHTRMAHGPGRRGDWNQKDWGGRGEWGPCGGWRAGDGPPEPREKQPEDIL
jgi:hypothetical protein